MNQSLDLFKNYYALLNNLSDRTTFGSGSLNYSDEKQMQKNELNVTASGIDEFDKYSFVFPSNIKIVKQFDVISQIKNESIKNQVESFLNKFQSTLFMYRNALSSVGKIPSLMIVQDPDDESVLAEWIFKEFRIGFSFEKDEKESSWFFVSTHTFDSLNTSGNINDDTIDELLLNFIQFVISHV